MKDYFSVKLGPNTARLEIFPGLPIGIGVVCTRFTCGDSVLYQSFLDARTLGENGGWAQLRYRRDINVNIVAVHLVNDVQKVLYTHQVPAVADLSLEEWHKVWGECADIRSVEEGLVSKVLRLSE